MSSSLIFRRLHAATIIGCALVISLTGAACSRSESKVKAKETTRTETRTVESAPIVITTVKATAREVPSYIQATGSLIADESSDVAPQTSGQVVATPVGIGAFVRQGAVIARLNDRDARLRLRQSMAGVQQAVAGVRQAEARLGLRPGGNFDASTIP